MSGIRSIDRVGGGLCFASRRRKRWIKAKKLMPINGIVVLFSGWARWHWSCVIQNAKIEDARKSCVCRRTMTSRGLPQYRVTGTRKVTFFIDLSPAEQQPAMDASE